MNDKTNKIMELLESMVQDKYGEKLFEKDGLLSGIKYTVMVNIDKIVRGR